jgi:class 3 adenylate cyclase
MLRSSNAMMQHIVNEQFLLGLFYGILLVMIGYNFFVFVSLRDVSYLFYVSYILIYGTFLFIWNGLAFQYFWDNSPLWHNRSIIVFMGLSGLSVFLFSQSYLDTRRITPRAHTFMNAMMFYFVIGIALTFILPYSTAIRIMYGAPIFTLPIILTVSVICIRKGYRPARYFLLAWILLLTSISMAALRNLNLLPSGALTIYGLQIGSALEIFLLSLGLADRINIIKQEKKAAQDEALRSTELLIETLQQSEQELERKVIERTAELGNANEEISRQLEILTEQSREIELANTALQEKTLMIEQEQERSAQLLLNILPQSIATRLMAGEKLIADRFENVTVIFADIAGFTPLSGAIPPEELVGLLDTIFSEFDAISERFGLEKIKTIGDCYMAVAGLPLPLHDHVQRSTDAALAMMDAVESLRSMFEMSLEMRIGVHTGAVIAGVIGKKKFAYDLWGDTVNIASRMESQSMAGKIQITEAVFQALQQLPSTTRTAYTFQQRGSLEIKGKGTMQTWFVQRSEG